MSELTRITVFVQQHRQIIGGLLAGLLLFLAGVQVGRITSPYYAAHPIIFNDRDCNGVPCSGGSLSELQELQAEGVTQRQPVGDSAQVAGVIGQGEFVASVNSDLFHHNSCATANRIKEENQIWFTTAQEALSSGYEPSACTRQKGY